MIGLPLLIPALIATARAPARCSPPTRRRRRQGSGWLILALYDLVFALLAYAVFDFLLED